MSKDSDLIHISLMVNDTEHIFPYVYGPFIYLSSEKCLFRAFAYVLIELSFLLEGVG